MQVRIFNWLDRDFFEISGEGRAGVTAEAAITELFDRFEQALQSQRMSLEDVVRVRVWGRDKDARARATAARAKILTGKRRVASSSFISREWFESGGVAGLDLLALRPRQAGTERRVVDFEPARNYLRYLGCESLLFFSGLTSDRPTLAAQVPDVLLSLANAFGISGASWSEIVKLSIFLDRCHDLAELRNLLTQGSKLDVSDIEFRFVDGFAGEKYLLEIEATAVRRP